MNNSIDDIYNNISNIYDYLLLIDIRVEKEFKLEDYKKSEFIELINNLMYHLGKLEGFINEYNIRGNKNE